MNKDFVGGILSDFHRCNFSKYVRLFSHVAVVTDVIAIAVSAAAAAVDVYTTYYHTLHLYFMGDGE